MHIVFSEPVSAVPARAQGPVPFVSYGDLAWNLEAGGRDCSVAASKGELDLFCLSQILENAK